MTSSILLPVHRNRRSPPVLHAPLSRSHPALSLSGSHRARAFPCSLPFSPSPSSRARAPPPPAPPDLSSPLMWPTSVLGFLNSMRLQLVHISVVSDVCDADMVIPPSFAVMSPTSRWPALPRRMAPRTLCLLHEPRSAIAHYTTQNGRPRAIRTLSNKAAY
ncbi:hypothetical protein B0H19DRAFT_1258384 [Mycena capillaripes]|nr:hypothetical protein B0H19DRAFT_1258384 [Mycena capillaripes]